ncbi:MAG: PHP domain-containing protein [Candidatus Lokiarchaeota archaeon]|nr:PHP domain-containing protein [Candidatus Lokiarchaeota archaeon]
MIDLHLHSSASDGSLTPSQLIEEALNLKIKAIAITDHDTIAGVKEFLSFGELEKIIIIPGIEISIRHEPIRELIDVHIIGLNIDHSSIRLINTIADQIKGRLEQKKAICKRLRDEFGYDISFDEVKANAGNGVVGRPHIVEIMTKNNPKKVVGKTKNELFKMISISGDAFVDRKVELNLEESIELIKSAGGIPILAHPGIYEVSDRIEFIEMCIKAGIEGIEVEYTYTKNRPFYGTDKANWAQNYFPEYFRKIAEKYNLIKSGGSDYHGGKKGIKIGSANVPDDYLKSFI